MRELKPTEPLIGWKVNEDGLLDGIGNHNDARVDSDTWGVQPLITYSESWARGDMNTRSFMITVADHVFYHGHFSGNWDYRWAVRLLTDREA